MSGLFDDEGKTPARGRKHQVRNPLIDEMPEAVIERSEAEEAAPILAKLAGMSALLEDGAKSEPEIPLGHPFEASIKAAAAIADDLHPATIELNIPKSAAERIAAKEAEQVNRFPISQERRAMLLNLVWERTRWRTGRVEWRDMRELLKDVIELL